MNLYLVTRWGNPFSAEGPDDEDTNYLVKASSHQEAARTTDALLAVSVTKVEGNREVEGFCHAIRQISEQAMGAETPAIIHGPWYEHMFVRGLETSRSWLRAESGNWEEETARNDSSS